MAEQAKPTATNGVNQAVLDTEQNGRLKALEDNQANLTKTLATVNATLVAIQLEIVEIKAEHKQDRWLLAVIATAMIAAVVKLWFF